MYKARKPREANKAYVKDYEIAPEWSGLDIISS